MFTRRMFLWDGGAGSEGADDSGASGERGKPADSGSDDDKPVLPDTVEGWEEFHKTKVADHTKVVADHKTATDAWEVEKTSLKGKLGTQGNELGALRSLKEQIAQNPKGYIQELAKEHKLALNFGEAGSMTMAEIMTKQSAGELEPAKAAELIQGLVENQISEGVSSRIAPGEEARITDYLRTKYKDFDDLSDGRNVLSAQLAAKGMTHHELLHLAVQGQNLPEALVAYGKEVEQTVMETILKKAKAGRVDPDGEGGKASDKAGSKSLDVDTVLAQMQNNVGR